MNKLMLAGATAAALLLTGATMDNASARMGGGGGFSGAAHVGGGGFSGGHVSGGGNFGGRVGTSSGFSAAPRAAVTGGSFNRGVTGTRSFSGTRGFAGTTGTRGAYVGRGATGGHWGWRHGHRHFFPGAAVAAGIGPGLAYGGWGYGDDCVAWDGWTWVNVCDSYYPYY